MMATKYHESQVSAVAPDIAAASDEYRSRFAGPVGEFFLETQTNRVLELASRCRGRRVLDVGGGHGQLAVPLVLAGYDVTVLGSDDTCRRQLSRELPENSFRFGKADLLNLPFPNRHFDLAFAFRLLAHLPDWPRLIHELCRVSRDGVVVDYPDSRSLNRFQRRLFGVKKAIEANTRPFQSFQQRQITECFGDRGFRIVAIEKQFLLPMVLHRALRCRPVSSITEQVFRTVGLTALWGSPVIVLAQPVRRY